MIPRVGRRGAGRSVAGHEDERCCRITVSTVRSSGIRGLEAEQALEAAPVAAMRPRRRLPLHVVGGSR